MKKIFLLLICIFIYASNAQAWNSYLIVSMINNDKDEVEIMAVLKHEDINQNVKMLQAYYTLIDEFKKRGWRHGKGRYYLGTVKLDYDNWSGNRVSVYSVTSIGRNDCPGKTSNKIKVRNNWDERTERKVSECINQVRRGQ